MNRTTAASALALAALEARVALRSGVLVVVVGIVGGNAS